MTLADILDRLLRRRPKPRPPAPPVPPPTGPGPTDADLARWPGDLWEAHNRLRRDVGLAAMAMDGRLAKAAQSHAEDSATRDRMGHDGSDGSTVADRVSRVAYRWSRLGENVAAGFDSVGWVVTAWLGSPGHKANMLGDYWAAGFGVARAKSGALHWVAVFSTPAQPGLALAPADRAVVLSGPIGPMGG